MYYTLCFPPEVTDDDVLRTTDAALRRGDAVGFRNFNLRIFNLRVSNPNKLIVDVFWHDVGFQCARVSAQTNTMKFRKSTVILLEAMIVELECLNSSFVELSLLSRFDKRLSFEQFEPTVSQSAVSFPPLYVVCIIHIIHIYIELYQLLYTYKHKYVYTYIHVYIYIYTHTYIYVYIYIYIYIHTYVSLY